MLSSRAAFQLMLCHWSSVVRRSSMCCFRWFYTHRKRLLIPCSMSVFCWSSPGQQLSSTSSHNYLSSALEVDCCKGLQTLLSKSFRLSPDILLQPDFELTNKCRVIKFPPRRKQGLPLIWFLTF